MGDRPIHANLISALASLKWLAGILVAGFAMGWGVHRLVQWAGVDQPVVRYLATGVVTLIGYAWISKRSAVHRAADLRLGVSSRWALAAGVVGVSYVACVLVSMAWLAPPVELRWASHWSFDSFVLLLAGAVIEEVAYRGLLLASLFRCLPATVANLMQATVFALMHLVGGARGGSVTSEVLANFFIVGLCAGSLCLASRSLLPGMLFHIVSNLVVVSLPFADASALGGWGVASGWQMDVGPAGPAWMNSIEAAFCLALIGFLELHRGKARQQLQR